MNTTAYHLGKYKPSFPSAKELHWEECEQAIFDMIAYFRRYHYEFNQ